MAKKTSKKDSKKADNGKAPAKSENAILLRKLSPRTICGKLEKPEKQRLLFKMGGIARAVQTGEGTYGPWTAFVGNFEAIRADGQVIKGPKCFISEPVQSELAAVIKDTGAPVEFALAVYISPADNKMGYEYIVSMLNTPTQSDALNGVRALMLEHKA